MSRAIEPPYTHGSVPRTAVLLVNLGTPDAPNAPALKRYLAEFLSDPRVVEIPAFIWQLILRGIILQVRPAKSAAKYASIWMPEGSPLAVWTQRQTQALTQRLQSHAAPDGSTLMVRHAMRYGQPSVAGVLDELKTAGARRILVLPLYPQYAAATTASVIDAVNAWSARQRWVPEFRFVNHHHDHPGYIAALAAQVRRHWAMHGQGQRLVLSFHGVPQRSLDLGDPYHCECYKTARLLRTALELPPERVQVTFQSRFGKAKWLQPYTEPTLKALAQQGISAVDVMCPGFTADCLETLEEIAMEAREAFLEAGGQTFRYIPCLNDQPDWLDALTDITLQHVQGWWPQSVPAIELAVQRQAAAALGAAR